MFSKITKFHKGMTLMELMVVIAIIGIMSAVGFSLWQSTKSDSYLRDAQREVASAIKTAQSYALQGRVQGGSVPCGYGVRFETDSYTIFYTTSAIGDCSDLSNTNLETHNLNSGTTITGGAGENVYFSVPFGVMSGTASTLTFENRGNPKTVTIGSGGSITEQ